MRTRLARTLCAGVVLAAAALVGVPGAAAAAPPPSSPAAAQRTPKVIPEQHHDVSPALRSMAPKATTAGDGESEAVGSLPHSRAHAQDPVVQSSAGTRAASVGASFDGLGTGFSGPGGSFNLGGVPPDPNSAVGATQVVEIVNSGFAVFSKTGTTQYGPANTNTLFSGFGGYCESTDDGDAVVRYDSLANR
ncbi:hypothetical protein [Amycolatopsis sp. NPDC004378]